MTFEIDQMELADVGHPRTLARAVHGQIRAQLGSVPVNFPLQELASQIGIVDITTFESDTFEGMLVIKKGEGVIGVNNKARKTRARFTIAHELGHFLIPTHRTGKVKFECGRADFSAERPNKGILKEAVSAQLRKEIEANEFAAELLVPDQEYLRDRERLGARESLLHVRALAKTYNVSTEMMARVYVQRAESAVGILFSKDGNLAKFSLPKQFPYMGLRKGVSLPSGSNALKIVKQGQQHDVPLLESINRHVWFDEKQDVVFAYEQTLLLNGGWAMTLLNIDRKSDHEDDSALLKPTDQMWSRERKGQFAWD